MDELTNDAKYFLTVGYKCYLDKIANGASKKNARLLGDIPDIQESLFPEWKNQDIADLSDELKDQGYVSSEQYWGPFPSEIRLTTKSIAYNEQKFKRDAHAVVDGIIKLKQLIF